MKPLSLASGDPVADRRADYAEMLFSAGDVAAAAELMADALALAAGWAAGWFRLGEMREAAGDPGRAAQAWREALRLDPADRAGASLKLGLAAGETPDAPPPAFVETLFDQYAERFDAALVGRLGYRAPELLMVAILATGRSRFGRAVDLGCGTGLMGERIRPLVDRLEGVDISAGMLRKARARGIYDRLEKADLQALVLPEGEADLVAAADVFNYLGRLDRVVAMAADALRPGGLLAFTVERHDGAEDFVLRPSRRFAHSEALVRRLLATTGLAALSVAGHALRSDRGEAVEGLVVVACRL